MKIYVASSWKNELQPKIVLALTTLGHSVYDFHKNTHGFLWKNINDINSKEWEPNLFKTELNTNSIVKKAFDVDYDAIVKADCCVMVLPCGKSAHTEAGWFKGSGKKVYVVMLENDEPELMYKL